MRIDYKPENKNNEQLKLEEKNKSNNKILGYTGLCVVGVAAFGIAGKVIWDKLKKNDNNNPGMQQNNQFKNDDNFTQNQLNDNNNSGAQKNNQFKNNDNFTQNQPSVNEWEGLVYDHDIIIDNKVLSPAFQKWFRQNMILLQQDFPICWHNASMQFLACPEIISGEEEYKQEFGQEYPQKIKTMINWMKQTIDKQKKDKNLKIEDYFTKKIYINKVPDGIRQNPDGKENKIIGAGKKAGGFIFFKDCSYDGVNGNFIKNMDSCNYGLFNGFNFIDNIVNLDEYNNGCKVILSSVEINGILRSYLTSNDIYKKLQFIKNKSKGFTLAYSIDNMDNGVDNFNQISGNMLKQNLGTALCYPSQYGYYPTFITFKATRPTDHWLGFYITYDENNKVKYAIRADGCEYNNHAGFDLLSYDELINTISEECRTVNNSPTGTLCIRYSPLNVVKQYYTPELMFNN